MDIQSFHQSCIEAEGGDALARALRGICAHRHAAEPVDSPTCESVGWQPWTPDSRSTVEGMGWQQWTPDLHNALEAIEDWQPWNPSPALES